MSLNCLIMVVMHSGIHEKMNTFLNEINQEKTSTKQYFSKATTGITKGNSRLFNIFSHLYGLKTIFIPVTISIYLFSEVPNFTLTDCLVKL